MYCGNAKGNYIPPMVVYKETNEEQTEVNGVSADSYTATKTGWFDVTTFQKWFFEVLSLVSIVLYS